MAHRSYLSAILAFLSISILGFVLIPNVPFDYCMLNTHPSYAISNDYACSNWPWFLYGASFVLTTYIVGPKRAWFWVSAIALYSLISIFDLLRMGEHILSIVASLPYNPFIHGAATALAVIGGINNIFPKKYAS